MIKLYGFDIILLSQVFCMSEQGTVYLSQLNCRIDPVVRPDHVLIGIADKGVSRGPRRFPYRALDKAYHGVLPCLLILEGFGQFVVHHAQRFGLIQRLIAAFLKSFPDTQG
ncbi:hypothetical protein D3C72_1959360 [compost metagenome]